VEAFNFSDGTGVGYYSIDPAAPIGGTDIGLIDVLYEEFSNDPNICPACGVGFGDLYGPFTVEVTAPTGSSAPKPSPLRLVTWGVRIIGGRPVAPSIALSTGFVKRHRVFGVYLGIAGVWGRSRRTSLAF
jgi:hypothetical protein